ncbi:peroxiredoxin-like family protein [Kaarinaea lacus]
MKEQNLTTISYNQRRGELIEQLKEMLPTEQLAVFNQDAEQLAENYPSPLKLTVGDKAVPFSLPNPQGHQIELQSLLDKGPVILTFYRGVWCPYCNLQLKTYEEILPQITEAGATLVAISPMTPDNSVSMQEQNELQFHVLSDVGNQTSRAYTTVFKNSTAAIQAMTELGYDFYGFYGDESGEIPVPATFVINQDGDISFASSNSGDYRDRAEPKDLLTALAKINARDQEKVFS